MHTVSSPHVNCVAVTDSSSLLLVSCSVICNCNTLSMPLFHSLVLSGFCIAASHYESVAHIWNVSLQLFVGAYDVLWYRKCSIRAFEKSWRSSLRWEVQNVPSQHSGLCWGTELLGGCVGNVGRVWHLFIIYFRDGGVWRHGRSSVLVGGSHTDAKMATAHLSLCPLTTPSPTNHMDKFVWITDLKLVPCLQVADLACRELMTTALGGSYLLG